MAKDQFTLEAAQKGKELVTRDGRPARYIAVLQKSNPQFPVVCEVYQYTEEEIKRKLSEAELPGRFEDTFRRRIQSDVENWKMENFTTTGEFLPPFEQPEDLFIKTI
jgi:hypothetical protein